MLSLVEHKKSFITLGPGFRLHKKVMQVVRICDNVGHLSTL